MIKTFLYATELIRFPLWALPRLWKIYWSSNVSHPRSPTRDLDFVTPADIFCRCEGGYVNDRFCILLHFDFLPLFKIILYIDLLIDTGTETQTCEHSVVAVNLSVKQSFGQFAGLSFGKRPPIGII